MFKPAAFLILLLCWLSLTSSQVEVKPESEKQTPLVVPTVIPSPKSPPKIKRLVLNKSFVFLPLPPNCLLESKTCKDDTTVDVSIIASDVDSDVLTYRYFVTGGRIIGQGAKVKWDLSSLKPGVYEITVAVDDGKENWNEIKKAKVTVRECEGNCSDLPYTCPTLSVKVPYERVAMGQPMFFTAEIKGGSQDEIAYHWTVSDGKIIEGQGTSMIKVDTDGLNDKTITATVYLGGLCEPCSNTANGAGKVVDF